MTSAMANNARATVAAEMSTHPKSARRNVRQPSVTLSQFCRANHSATPRITRVSAHRIQEAEAADAADLAASRMRVIGYRPCRGRGPRASPIPGAA